MATHEAAGLTSAAGPAEKAGILRVMSREMRGSGRRPLGEELRRALQEGSPDATWFWEPPHGRAYAGMLPGEVPVVEITADPGEAGASTSLAALLRAAVPHAQMWAHGERSQAGRAARNLGMAPARELWLMARELAGEHRSRPVTGVRLRPFDPATDKEAWLALNRSSFAALPDQSSWTRRDLDDRLAADWYDPAGFIVAERDGRLAGFHWTKTDPAATIDGTASGEVYVIAVAPEFRGTGLAAALLDAGLAHLASRGLRMAHLFVDASNTGAVRLYRRDGFRHRDTDSQYVW